ncbi:MAG TPA: leucine-rich repeat domain-containing protein [Candidatus Acidoferrum sp.]|nr:leucine-rich repeat domain-containing protein [Candidatus Acidoferrum sp.]
MLLVVWMLPLPAKAQFTFTTNNGAITITGYTGSAMNVAVPAVTNGMPVVAIGAGAFNYSSITNLNIPNSVTNIAVNAFRYSNLVSISIPGSVTSIGGDAFENCVALKTLTIPDSVSVLGKGLCYSCVGLSSVTLGNGLTSLPDYTFQLCSQLASISIPHGVGSIGNDVFQGCTNLSRVSLSGALTSIGGEAFNACTGLTNITFPNGVTYIGGAAFGGCTRLTSAYFMGNSPSTNSTLFLGSSATVFYLPGTVGWTSVFGSRPTAPWVLPYPVILYIEPSFGVQTSGFSFLVSWATNTSIVVEATANVADSSWSAVSTNALNNGTNYFSDPNWSNYPARFYRVSSL